jgi:predicted CXXCH cytochrome family protein
MNIVVFLSLLILTACGIADPEVIPYDSQGEAQDASAGLNPTSAVVGADQQIFNEKIMPVIKARCTSCHNPQHAVPFATMLPTKIQARLAAATGCGLGAFENFLKIDHPGGDVSSWFDEATRQNFSTTCP